MPWIWTAIVLNTHRADHALSSRDEARVTGRRYVASPACSVVFGIWIEKGMGLIIPAFIPSPLGRDRRVHADSQRDLVCLGIWAFGLLLFTIFVRITIPVLSGRLDHTTGTTTCDLAR